MKVRAFSILPLLLLFLGLATAHCDCDDPKVRPCVNDDDCKAGECCRDDKCTKEREYDGGCPPTHECSRDDECESLGEPCMECKDNCCQSFACESDADCPEGRGSEAIELDFD